MIAELSDTEGGTFYDKEPYANGKSFASVTINSSRLVNANPTDKMPRTGNASYEAEIKDNTLIIKTGNAIKFSKNPVASVRWKGESWGPKNSLTSRVNQAQKVMKKLVTSNSNTDDGTDLTRLIALIKDANQILSRNQSYQPFIKDGKIGIELNLT